MKVSAFARLSSYLALLATVLPASHGALIHYDGFEGTPGAGTPSGWTETDQGGAYLGLGISEGSLTYPSLATTGHKWELNSPRGTASMTFNEAGLQADETIFFSFLLRVDDVGGLKSSEASMMHLAPMTGAGHEVVATVGFGRYADTDAEDEYHLSFDGDHRGFSHDDAAGISPAIKEGETVLIVGSYARVSGGGNVKFWVNPDPSTLGNSLPPTPDYTDSANTSRAVARFKINSTSSGALPGSYFLDEFRFGSTWADVTPGPEPYGFPLIDGLYLNTGAFLGWLYPTDSQWAYSYDLGSWLWIAADSSDNLGNWSGAWSYVLGLEPPVSGVASGETAYGYPVIEDNIDTGSFLRWLEISGAPWAYAWALNTWIWVDGESSRNLRAAPQSWVYFRNAGNAYAETVLADGPVAYWRFSETGGVSVVDSVAGISASLGNEPFLDVEGQGSAISFEANRKQSMTAQDSALELESSFSVEFWIHHAFLALGEPIISKNDAFRIRRGGSDRLNFTSPVSGDSTNLLSIASIPAAEWTHVVAVRDSEAAELRIYINGALDNSVEATGTLTPASSPLMVGAEASLPRNYNGMVDEVALYDYALSPEQIAAHFHAASFDHSGFPIVVSDVEVSNIKMNAAGISWKSSLPSTGQVRYGTDPADMSLWTDPSTEETTEHSLTIGDLTPSTTYYFRIVSTNSKGRRDGSEIFAFETTEQVDPLALQNVESAQIMSNSALVRWETNNYASSQVRYGLSASELTRTSELIDEEVKQHNVVLLDLQPETTYYYEVTSTDVYGDTATSSVQSFTTLAADAVFMTDELTQFGITWKFDKEYRAGRFITGDWWVVGPVNVVSVSPAPSVAPADELNNFGPNQWGDAGLQDNKSMRNGSMVVMTPGNRQGYDSRGLNYRAEDSISFPYSLAANRSLISSRSQRKIPNPRMFHAIMWESEKNGFNAMRTAAILTCLSEPPPADAFRPAYVGTEKNIYTESQLQWDLLQNLDYSASLNWKQWERYFERPWLDHFNGSWHGQHFLPNDNQASYGREIVRIVGQASLMLHLDVPQERKRKLLIGLVQNGIDLAALVKLGGNYNEGGGHTSGRKWPVLFAGLMLDEPEFQELAVDGIFHEDTQTYYGEGWAGQKALWQMIIHHGVRSTYMEQHPDTWATYDSGWARTSESYRTCCTIKAWPGQTLAALLMGAKAAWNHNAYFDNVDDWMREEDLYAAGRGGIARPSTETTAQDAFVTDMWRLYRDDVPEQPDGDLERKWIPTGGGTNGSWTPNPKPE